MKKGSKIILISSLVLFSLIPLGYGAFVIYKLSVPSEKIETNSYTVNLYNENTLTKTISPLNEDSYFTLPNYSDSNILFKGWKNKNSSVTTIFNGSISIQDLLINNNEDKVDKVIDLYTYKEIDPNYVLINVSDETITPTNTYQLLEESTSTFSLNNLTYKNPSQFVEVYYDNVAYSINDTIDISKYKGNVNGLTLTIKLLTSN